MAETAFAYLDESGDMGWRFHLPYLNGGSSRYFVVAIAMGIHMQYRRIGKVIEQLHALQRWTSAKEKKWSTIKSHGPRLAFCQLAARELASNPAVKVYVAVFHKETAPDFLRSLDLRSMHSTKTEQQLQVLEARNRGRAHLAYAMLVAESLGEHLPSIQRLSYCPDELNEGTRTLEHILAYRLLIQQKRAMSIARVDRKAAMQRGLDFADMCAGAVFEAYQFGDPRYLAILKPYLLIKDFAQVGSAALRH